MADNSPRPWYKNKSLLTTIGLWVVWILCAQELREDPKPWEIEGEPSTTSDFVTIGTFWAGLVSLGISATLLATKRWWLSWAMKREPVSTVGPAANPRFSRWGWLGIAAVLLFAASIRGPMMNRQVLRDEQDNLRRNIFGFHYVELHHRDIRFQKAEWEDAFFENRLANNPILFSVCSKASLEIWRKVTGAPEDQFSKVAFRMPSLLFGLGSIVMLYIFLCLIGRPVAGIIAGILAALHPLHIEYCVQARGYGIVLFCVGTAAVFGLLAVQNGRWRYFLGFGFSLLGILYAFAGGIYFVAPTGLAMAGVLAWQWLKRRDAKSKAAFVRFAIAGIVAGTLYAQLVAPSLPQISNHLSGKYEKIPLHPRWLFTTYTQYTSGIWIDMEVHEHLESEDISIFDNTWGENLGGVTRYLTSSFIRKEPLHALLIFVILPALTLVGFIAVIRMGGIIRWFAVAAALAPLLDFVHHHFITELYAYFWYWIYSLLWLLAFIGTGLASTAAWIAEKAKRQALEPIIATALALIFFGIYIWETTPGRPNRYARNSGVGSGKVVFPRGKSDWVIYENGYQLRVREGDEIPETFSGVEEK